MPFTNFPNGVSSLGIPQVGGGFPFPPAGGRAWFVDGSRGGDSQSGKDPARAVATIQEAVTLAGVGDIIFVYPKTMTAGATDPVDYAETIIIPAGKANLSIIGVPRGLTQGTLPQIKKGSGSTALLTVRSPGCLIANLGFNGSGSTGGGILLDSDGSTKDAFGTTIVGCHFKNCKGSAAAATGGAIMWGANGGGWNVRIEGCDFLDNRAGIVLLGTGVSVPKNIVIKNNIFYSSANTNVDCDIYLAAGSGVNGLVITGNDFATVDVPGYATSPTAARYLDLTNCVNGMLARNMFACLVNPAATEVTFGASGTAAKIPVTVRMAGNIGETSSTTEQNIVYRV